MALWPDSMPERNSAQARRFVGENSGQLVRIGATKTLLETDEGQISVPNVILLNEVVRLRPKRTRGGGPIRQ